MENTSPVLKGCFSCTHLVSTALAAFLWPISRASALIDSISTVSFPVLVFFRPTITLASINPFSTVQFSRSVMSNSVTSRTAASQASLSIANSQSLLKLMSIESVMPSNHLILCRPLLLLPSIFPSIRVFSNESALCIKWPKYWSFSFISPSNECSGLISCRMNWLDLFRLHLSLVSFTLISSLRIIHLLIFVS